MIKGLLGKKLGMTQIFKEEGEVVPVTVLEAGPCPVLKVISGGAKKDIAVQLGFGAKKQKHVNKPDMGNFKKSNVSPVEFIKEVKADNSGEIKSADTITVDIFKVGEYVDVTGTSIGKGFQGGVKRWHWKGGSRTHGSMTHRRPGSIGSSTSPGRVLKGRHLPGHMGNRRITVQGLEVVDLDKENNLMLVKGAVPGHKGSFLVINKSFKKFKKEPKPEAQAAAKKKEDPLKKSKKSVKKIV